jgi:hypothetical protein
MATGSKMIPMTIPGNLKEDFSIPDNMVGLVIGKKKINKYNISFIQRKRRRNY